ncbi:complement decay-accelerating factor transmembrane isoform-like [Oncorhynchus kisutch]|uniref:complement decay-accelerating factor transmembrane isoform-like n=1 Tax=Oncorhynchus kisutch TaxID=8019 RepID=UPI0012DD9A35|nr:complement decay-accelerating factor transmembrane isoform-like [Oncorhynchus kisutch]
MGALTGLLSALVALLWTLPPGSLGEECSRFRHMENGRTFFRYSGLYVAFTCNPGYKIHGYRTNSCVSGQWTREPPVCVASGCPSPGDLLQGVTSVTEDGSWALFSCDAGYRLYGHSLLYCKGQNWNGTKPVCKESSLMMSPESDMMSPGPPLFLFPPESLGYDVSWSSSVPLPPRSLMSLLVLLCASPLLESDGRLLSLMMSLSSSVPLPS